ncbi:toll/interleukin-1 receptor domain-containing protein [Brevibacillus sp. H7]|uniref:toll/interleukin-1 receptor domain-containing protein n=1 Tax=Brevibacillus sp. H7 TaxID=3349138 RepID=UPI0038287B07
MNQTAFISYSWDNQGHENWVYQLANKLRENGVNATFDEFEHKDKTTNLYRMMIKAIRDFDRVIVVITENYA